MATRAEQARAETQREESKKKRAKKARKKAATPPPKKRVTRTAAKATVAVEERGEKRPSRKSTRGSANRLKSDTNLVLREERAKTSPENRYRKQRARSSRVRGSKK